MYRIMDKLFVGRSACVPMAEDFGFSILGACKRPLHQQNARLSGCDRDGYLKISPDEPEYLFAKRDHALYLNLIDGDNRDMISDSMIAEALAFIDTERIDGRTVFIACNQAESRSPSIAFMYMIRSGFYNDCETFDDALKNFKDRYPFYHPRKGMLDYTRYYFETRKELLRRTNSNGSRQE